MQTALVLGKSLVYITVALSSFEGDADATLAFASRAFFVAHTLLCTAGGLLLGAAARHLPNVFPDHPLGGPRSPLSAACMVLGMPLGIFGVGLRGLRRGNPGLDECAIA